jgi:hypothetical protein
MPPAPLPPMFAASAANSASVNCVTLKGWKINLFSIFHKQPVFKNDQGMHYLKSEAHQLVFRGTTTSYRKTYT